MICNLCNAKLGTGKRWVLLDETQKCIWGAPNEMPEVDIQLAVWLGNYCCEQHALEACDNYLSLAGATAKWSDVRPIESCAICDKDFSTTSWHKVLTLSVERGDELDPVIIDGTYPARFCNQCVPIST
jgi:hypothetical protein